jgi:hypothetical protein
MGRDAPRPYRQQSKGTVSTEGEGIPDVFGPPWTQTIALVAAARDIRLCDGLVSCPVGRRKGCDDQIAGNEGRGLETGWHNPTDCQTSLSTHEREGRHDGLAVQDWAQAEREIRKVAPHKCMDAERAAAIPTIPIPDVYEPVRKAS